MIKEYEYFDSEKLQKSVSDLSQKAGIPANFTLKPIAGGRNNRVFLICYNDDKKLLLKAYFEHPNDSRNRVKAEYSFLNFAWNKVKCVPKPIAADFQNKIALYEFIEGRKLSVKDIKENRVKEASDFYIEINKYKNAEEAKNLPVASEACFSIKEHIGAVNRRIGRLKKIDGNSESNLRAISFINNELLAEWNKTTGHLNKFIDKFNINPNEKISKDETCISPSDFGYHNAILNNSNKLIFIDFEYAGCDDPAKMACDFFCQPEVPVPFRYFDSFIEAVAGRTANPEKLKQKIDILLPLYKIKWCCILLNEFLEMGSERRNFAYATDDYEKEKIKQLEKARKYLESIEFKS